MYLLIYRIPKMPRLHSGVLSILLFALTLTLVGCGGGESDSADGPTEAQTEDQNSPQEAKQDDAPTARSARYEKGYFKKHLDIAVVEPTVVGRQTIRDYYDPETKKQPKRVYEVKILSNFNKQRPQDGGWRYDGRYIEYYAPTSEGEPGAKFAEGSYQDDQREGEWKFWHANGQVAKEVTYKDNLLHGSWLVYRKDGTTKRRESYQAGKPHGPWAEFSEDGKVKIAEYEYKDGSRHGKFTARYDDGTVREVAHFVDGRRHGERTLYHPNGQIAVQVTYRDGKRHGQLVQRNESGKVLREVEFEDGELKRS